MKSYRTHFPQDENPISEGGIWVNGKADGRDWYDIVTRNGVAYGAESAGEYTDPTALLKGEWGRNQATAATVYSRNPTDRYFQEVEIRLRGTLSLGRCTGYEVFWRCLKTEKAYAEIVRWNGKLMDWTSLAKLNGAEYGVKHGDIVRAMVIGNVISRLRILLLRGGEQQRLNCVCVAFSPEPRTDTPKEKTMERTNLERVWDDRKICANPHKGWYHHYYDNALTVYGPLLKPDDFLTDFPGLNHIYLRVDWSHLEPAEGQFAWDVIDR